MNEWWNIYVRVEVVSEIGSGEEIYFLDLEIWGWVGGDGWGGGEGSGGEGSGGEEWGTKRFSCV